jgi:adenylate cyclase
MAKKFSKLGRGISIGMIAGVIALGVSSLGWLDAWERPTWTWRARFFAQRETLAPKVKLIMLDQASLDWAQQENGWGWPWPREVYGAISAFCLRGGARAVAFDMLFTEPSVNGVYDDEAMGEALLAGPPAILGLMSGGSQTTWPDSAPLPGFTLTPASVPSVERLLFPVPEVAKGARAMGHVTGLPDGDGVYRRMMPVCRFDGKDVPALGLAAWLQADGTDVAISKAEGRFNVGSHVVPLDSQDQTILRFKGVDGLPHDANSAAAVIQSELRLQADEAPSVAPETFKDCIVFVGCSAPALLDLRPTPLNAKCPGVMLHATFVDNLITDSFMAEAPWLSVVLGVLILSVCAAVCLTYGGRWWQAGPLAVVGLGAPLAIGFAGYSGGWWWPVAVQTVGSALAMVGALTANYWSEGRQKAFIKQAFKHYLSGDVIEKILRDPNALLLGGEKRELTIMFTDLAGFSSFSERLGPVELTALLNDYLTEMTDIIMEEGGTLDKYEGDAIICFWNAPLAQPDHAVRACRAVLRCQRRLAELRQTYVERTGAELRMRVGLNTGEVVVGNMGSTQRFNYTILGDAANLAARLEGANKAFGTETMISENTWRQAASEFRGRKLADLRVVGRKTPTTVYEMTGLAGEPEPAEWAVFADGLDRFRAGDFVGAVTAFSSLPDDPAARHYVHRCQALIAQPPTDWDGVWELTSK